ncbi:MAG TPA: NAD(+) synthase [Gammaproteobacteria bacterium]|nr:NAD(+) synthase [Gammaproteobacteria bacterium]
MKVCLGQIDTTPGDFEGNLARIVRGIDKAGADECDVVVFPELTIPGYLSQDLVYDPAFIDRNLAALEEIASYTTTVHPGLHVVVGYIDRNEGFGKPFFNMAAVVAAGSVVARYTKQLLPFYDVFDELRYYEPGDQLTILSIADQKVGIAICEDLWNDKGTDDYNYEGNPLSQYREQGVEVILSLNSSPYVHDKGWQRLNLIETGKDNGSPITVVYVNQRGGQDELVFDGQSFVLREGQLLYLGNEIHEDSYETVDLDKTTPLVADVNESKTDIPFVALFDLLVLCLRDYVEKSGFSQVVLASSGGVDSAVVCKIACEAVGAENVHAIRMPSIFSSEHSRDDALELHENLGCWDYEVPIDHQPVLEMLNAKFKVHDDSNNVVETGTYAEVADENMQARLRDLYVMHFSNAYGAMPLSTGNKTESACGYYTHFDMNFSFAPIKDLYKYQVFDIARRCSDIPANIWIKPPSAELAKDQTDESSLLPYAVLDPIVRAHVEDYESAFSGFESWIERHRGDRISSDINVVDSWLTSGRAEVEFQKILSLIGRMEYKRRQTCPGIKVSKVAFGIGRRIPIVEKWS